MASRIHYTFRWWSRRKAAGLQRFTLAHSAARGHVKCRGPWYTAPLIAFGRAHRGSLIVLVYLWCKRSASWVDERTHRHGACCTLKVSSVAFLNIHLSPLNSLSLSHIYCTQIRPWCIACTLHQWHLFCEKSGKIQMIFSFTLLSGTVTALEENFKLCAATISQQTMCRWCIDGRKPASCSPESFC